MWYYKAADEKKGPLSFEELEQLVASGLFTKKTLVRGYTTSKWTAAESSPLGGRLWPKPPAYSQEYLDVFSISKKIRVAMYLLIAVAAIAAVGNINEYRVLSLLEDGSGMLQEEIMAEAESSDLIQGLVGITQMVLWFVTAIMFCIWTYRCNVNVRVMGATGLNIRPGWAIGWYFVPIMSLWKPYQAMKEVWQASLSPTNWYNVKRGKIMSRWWFFWIVSNFIDQAAFKWSLKADTIGEMKIGNIVMTVSDVFSIPTTIVTIMFVVALTELQQKQIDRAERRPEASTPS